MLTRRQFLVRYVLMVNLYGNLLVLCGALCTAAGGLLARYWLRSFETGEAQHAGHAIGVGVLITVLGIGAVASLWLGISVTTKFDEKYKFYRVTMIRIQKRGFSYELLEDSFDSPCYRQISRQMLREIGRLHEYRKIKRWVDNGFALRFRAE